MDRSINKAERGFTLLETLIALIVLSVGMLGIAALHIDSLRNSRGANLRTTALTLATDLAEKMRANRSGALAGDYVIASAAAGVNNDCADDTTGGPTVACTPATMAQHDLWLWKQRLGNPQSGLPGPGTGQVLSDGLNPPTLTIIVAWNENGTDDGVSLVLQP